ncbi:MAG: PIN domain-containing protein [Propionivibrio sp.]
MLLVDTDVLIWHLRGYPQATRRLDELDTLTLSAVSYLEVLQGMRNKAELMAVKKMLQHRAATLLPVSEAITHGPSS